MTDLLELLETPDEQDLRASVREMLEAECPWQSVLEVVSRPEEPHHPKLWRTLGGMGLTGLLVPEAHGGAGTHWRSAAVVVEELGRAVAPVPFLSSAVVATTALGYADAPDLLGRLASAELTAVLAVPYGLWSKPPLMHVADGGAVTGTIRGVADAAGAGLLLVPTGDGVYAVPAGAARLTQVASLDETRPLCDVELVAAPGRLVAPLPAVSSALRVAATMIAAEQVGLASWCLDTTVAHLKERYQFGRPVGSFQGLKHRLADLWVDLTQARAVVGYAVTDLAAGGQDASVAASLAKIVASEVAVRAAEECVQMHGGIGFTWEHPAHLYLKRAKASAIAYGSPDRHRTRLSALVDLPLEDA